MGLLTKEVQMTEEQYIQFEVDSDIRHEYINGKLIGMPGEALFNNKIAQALLIIFRRHLKPKGYKCYIQDLKLKVPGEVKYSYPDIFVTKEETNVGNKYIRNYPEIIVEVRSKRTRKYDAIDKFINYQKFDSLNYYFLVEPYFPLVSVYSRRIENNDGEMESYTDKNGIIPLSYYSSEISMSDIYEG